MEEKIFKQDAKTIVDMLFDNKLFKEHIGRDNMTALEDFISFSLNSRFDGYLKMEKISKKLKERESTDSHA